MSHRQAYHTSCREGLGGHSGFQFNAASPGITREQLAALASSHAGYHPPRDSPLEPTAEELARFPVALKYRAAEGVGPVLSRTVYVGREFRGRAGEPDTGRFGNYFSHMVLGSETGDAFDGLLPIELWNAPHWCTSESPSRDLRELDVLAPGPADLESTLASLGGVRREGLAAALDGALAAVEGGPRVVLVEPEVELAAAWVAWISFALPPGLATQLTFTTFTGQPRYAQDVCVCVTTPGCDLEFADHELGRDVLLLEPAARRIPEKSSLYARVAAALAEEGAEAVARGTRAVGDEATRRGAELAVLGGRVDLAQAEEIPLLLELLVGLVLRRDWASALASAAALPSEATQDTLPGWGAVHAAARGATEEPAGAIADAALQRLLVVVGELPSELPDVDSDAPTSPSTARLASWLQTLEGCESSPELAALIRGGVRLGLVGCNAALDRRVARSILDGLQDSRMRAVFAPLAADPRRAGLIEEVIEGLAAEAFTQPRQFELLRELLGERDVSRAAARCAARTDVFEERVVWARLRIERAPSELPEALAELIPLAGDSGRREAIREILGPGGPRGVDQHVSLLRAYDRAGYAVPAEDIDGARSALADLSLRDLESGRALVDALRRVASYDRVRRDPLFLAWHAATHTPPKLPFADWAAQVAESARADRSSLPDKRYEELWELAGDVCASALELPEPPLDSADRADGRAPRARARQPAPDYTEAVTLLAEGFREHWPSAAARGLEQGIVARRDPQRLIASAFVMWRRLPVAAGDLLEASLPDALAGMSVRQLEAVGGLLPESEERVWLAWLEQHPPQGTLSRTFSRIVRREGGRQ